MMKSGEMLSGIAVSGLYHCLGFDVLSVVGMLTAVAWLVTSRDLRDTRRACVINESAQQGREV
jgi:hypothetical protein